MIKTIVFVAALALAAPAVARTHTQSEQQKTIDLCRTISVDTDTYRKGMAAVAASSMSAEDKDYVLDMCAAYIGGKLDGLKEVKRMLDQQ